MAESPSVEKYVSRLDSDEVQKLMKDLLNLYNKWVDNPTEIPFERTTKWSVCRAFEIEFGDPQCLIDSINSDPNNYCLQPCLLCKFVGTFVTLVANDQELVAWIISNILSATYRFKAHLRIRIEAEAAIVKLLAALDSTLVIESLLLSMKDLMMLNTRTFACDSGPQLGSIVLMNELLQRNAEVTCGSDNVNSVKLNPTNVCLWNLDECRSLQTMISRILVESTAVLRKLPMQSFKQTWPILLYQLKFHTWQLRTTTLLLIERLIKNGLCRPLFGYFILDHLLALVAWQTENQDIVEQQYLDLCGALELCLTCCIEQMDQSLCYENTNQFFPLFVDVDQKQFSSLLDMVLRQICPGSSFFLSPQEIQKAVGQMALRFINAIKELAVDGDDNANEYSGAIVRQFMIQLLSVQNEMKMNAKSFAGLFAATVECDQLLYEVQSDDDCFMEVEDEDHSTLGVLLSELSDEGSYLDNPLTLLPQLRCLSFLVTSLSSIENQLFTQFLTVVIQRNSLYKALNIILKVPNVEKKSCVQAVLDLAANIVYAKALTKADVDLNEVRQVLSIPWNETLKAEEPISMNFGRNKNLDMLPKALQNLGTFIEDEDLKLFTLDSIALVDDDANSKNRRRTLFRTALAQGNKMKKAISVLNCYFYSSRFSFDQGFWFLEQNVLPLFSLKMDIVASLLHCLSDCLCACVRKVTLERNSDMKIDVVCLVCNKTFTDSNIQLLPLKNEILAVLRMVIKDIRNGSCQRKVGFLTLLSVVLRHCDVKPTTEFNKIKPFMIGSVELMAENDQPVITAMGNALSDITSHNMDDDLNRAIQNAIIALELKSAKSAEKNQEYMENSEKMLPLLLRYLTIVMRNSTNQELFSMCYTQLVLISSGAKFEHTPSVELILEAKEYLETIASSLGITIYQLHLRQCDDFCTNLVKHICDFAECASLWPDEHDRSSPTDVIEKPLLKCLESIAYICDMDLISWLKQCQQHFIPSLLVYGARSCDSGNGKCAAEVVFKLIVRNLSTNRHCYLADRMFAHVLRKAVIVTNSDAEVNRMLTFTEVQGRQKEWPIEKYFRQNLYDCIKLLMRSLSVNENSVLRMLMRIDLIINSHHPFTDLCERTDPGVLTNLLERDSRFLGILLDFSQAFTDNGQTVSLNEKRIILNSLTLMFHYVQPLTQRFHQKVLFVLRSATSITELVEECTKAWLMFVQNITLNQLVQLLPDILASVFPLLTSVHVDQFLHLIFETKRTEIEELDKNRFGEFGNEQPVNVSLDDLCAVLRGIPNIGRLEGYFRGETPSLTYQLNACYRLLVQEQTYLKDLALKKLTIVLQDYSNSGQLYSIMADEKDNTNLIIVDLIQALIEAVRSGESNSDKNMQILAADCLGCLGAIDPGRLGLELSAPTVPGRGPQNRTAPKIVFTEYDLRRNQVNVDFVCLLIKRIVCCWMLVSTQQHNEMCLFTIQQLLKELKCETECNTEGTAAWSVWQKLAQNHKDLLQPLILTRFKMQTSEEVDPDHVTRPIITHALTFPCWISTWVIATIKRLKTSRVNSLFVAAIPLIECDSGFARFILPHVIIKAAEDDNRTILTETFSEIRSVLIAFCEGDHKSLSRNALTLAAQTVFFLIDCLRQLHVLLLNITANEPVSMRYRIMRDNVGVLLDLDTIYNQLQDAAVNCQSYARALMTLEMANKNVQHKNYPFSKLQELYSYLDEPDGVCGSLEQIKTIRTPQACEYIRSFESTGSYAEALPLYETLAQKDEQDTVQQLNCAKCMLKINQPSAAYLLANSMDNDPDYGAQIRNVKVEALCKLQRWDQLTQVLEKEESALCNSWNEDVGCLLTAMNKKDKHSFDNILGTAKEKLIEPLIASTMESGSYERAYGIICKLHLLCEMNQAANRFIQFGDKKVAGLKEDEPILIDWKKRIKLVQQSPRTMEQLLEMRRYLLSLVPAAQKSQTVTSEIHNSWLQSARSARLCGHTQTVGHYLAQARVYCYRSTTLETIVEESKCHWAKGAQQEAIQTLRKALSDPKTPETTAAREEKLAWIKAKLQFATYMEAAGMEPVNNLWDIYRECDSFTRVNKNASSEHLHYKTAVFADENVLKRDFFQKRKQRDFIKRLIRFYGNSLQFGSYFLSHSMPRMLTLWLDYCVQEYEPVVANDEMKQEKMRKEANLKSTAVANNENDVPTNEKQADIGTISQLSTQVSSANLPSIIAAAPENVKEINDLMIHFLEQLPTYQFYSAFSQLISRIQHPCDSTFMTLKTILVKIFGQYPQQSLWLSIGVLLSKAQGPTNNIQLERCKLIYADVKSKYPHLRPLIQDFEDFSTLLEKMANDKQDENDKRPVISMRKYNDLYSLFGSSNSTKAIRRTRQKKKIVSEIMIPFQSLFDVSFSSPKTHVEPSQEMVIDYPSHDPCSSTPVHIIGFEDDVEILDSKQKPKKIKVKGSDGRTYSMLLKEGDDLRADKRLVEFNKVVNMCLRRDPEARRRQLHIRTYSVIPLGEKGGMVEWVENVKPLRYVLAPLFKRSPKGLMNRNQWAKYKYEDPLEKKLQYFEKVLLPRHAPVLGHWFKESFTEPHGWYAARLAFTRTTAVMSMVGFVVGLGDRHSENILIDQTCGDVFHVDYNLLFNKGEDLGWPEIIPFRLTQNMIDGFGPLGIEGPFRRGCEMTMKVLREKRNMLISMLYAFVHDPLFYDVTNERSQQNRLQISHDQLAKPVTAVNMTDSDQRIVTWKATKTIDLIDRRIKGEICSKRINPQPTGNPLYMSVEGQVDQLIKMATDHKNLANTFPGWAAFI